VGHAENIRGILRRRGSSGGGKDGEAEAKRGGRDHDEPETPAVELDTKMHGSRYRNGATGANPEICMGSPGKTRLMGR